MLGFAAISTAVLGVTRSLDLFAKERPVVARETERGSARRCMRHLAKALGRITLRRVLRGADGLGPATFHAGRFEIKTGGAAGVGRRRGVYTRLAVASWRLGGCRAGVGRTTHGHPHAHGHHQSRRRKGPQETRGGSISHQGNVVVDRPRVPRRDLQRGTGPRLGGLASVVTGDRCSGSWVGGY